MPLQRLEHYLVLSDDIHRTRDFYRDVLGMAEGFRPELDFPGYWLYLGDVPCIHIAEWESYAAWTKKVGIPVSTRAHSTGSVDHIAFNGTGFAEVRARLVARQLQRLCGPLAPPLESLPGHEIASERIEMVE